MTMGPLDLLKENREDLIRSYDEAIAAGPQGIRSESTGRFKDGQESFVELNRPQVLNVLSAAMIHALSRT